MYKDICVGSIQQITSDMPEHWGTFTPNSNAVPLMPCWHHMTDEEQPFEDPPYDKEYFNDANYEVELNCGTRKPIYVPAIYPDGEIAWTYRSDCT